MTLSDKGYSFNPTHKEVEQDNMRLDLGEMARQRINQFVAEAIRYWQYIGQSGLFLSVIILFILGLVYYDQLLAGIPSWWPMEITYALIFGWLCVRAPQRHFIEEADLVFLTPVEQEMTHYFNKTCLYNLSVQMGGVVVCLILLYPVYRDLVQGAQQPGWVYFLLPVLLKGWNYYAHWSLLGVTDERIRNVLKLSRFLYSFVLLLWWFEGGALWLVIILGPLGMAFALLDRLLTRDQRCPWLLLVEQEKRQKSRYYSFCQSFVDVPQHTPYVNKRIWLDWIFRGLPFKQETAFHYFYLKAWLRSRDAFGIYVRLTLLGVLGILLLEDLWIKVVLYGLILFMTAVQMRSIAYDSGQPPWLQLFPINEEVRQASRRWFIHRLFTTQAILLSVTFPLSGVPVSKTLMIFSAALLLSRLYSRQKKRGLGSAFRKVG